MIKVFTWNLGANDIDKNAFNNLIKDKDKTFTDDDIIVFGFQEINTIIFDNIESLIKSKFTDYNVNSFLSKHFGDFKLGIFVVSKINLKDFTQKTIKICSKKNCNNVLLKIFPTKGALIVKFKKGDTTFRLICVHLPFASKDQNFNIESLKKFYKIENNTILFGDLNSRSTIGGEYAKNFDYTPGSEPDAIKNSLTSACTSDGSTLQKANVQYIDILKNTDTLDKEKLSKLSELGLKEANITFPPSYKIKVGTTCYQLSKDGKGRLPGYADRIFATDNFEIDNYNIILAESSDHLPVYANIIYPETVKSFGRRRRSKKQRRRSRRKMNRRSRKK